MSETTDNEHTPADAGEQFDAEEQFGGAEHLAAGENGSGAPGNGGAGVNGLQDADLRRVSEVPLELSVEIGRTQMTVGETLDLRAPTAFILGHETQGIDPDLPLDGAVTIPMAAGESLNVAMAETALLFEAARQRRASQ